MSFASEADIITSGANCNKCELRVDNRGYHANSTAERHNALRNELNKSIRTAGLGSKIEQKCNSEMINNCNNNDQVKSMQGDVKMLHSDKRTRSDLHLDTAVGNAKWRSCMAKEKETQKLNKYENEESIKPIAIETVGVIGPIFKKMLQDTANRVEERKSKPFALIMNQIRTRKMSILMKHNSDMILSCIYP